VLPGKSLLNEVGAAVPRVTFCLGTRPSSGIHLTGSPAALDVASELAGEADIGRGLELEQPIFVRGRDLELADEIE
jgi:hypothetical protein